MTNSMATAVSWRDNCGAVTLHLNKVKVPRPPDKYSSSSSQCAPASTSNTLMAQNHAQHEQQRQARVAGASAQDMKTVALQRELLADEQESVLIGTKQQRLADAATCPRGRILVARAACGVEGHAQWEPCPQRGRAVLTALFVESQYRRAGVGSALLAVAEADALSCGFAFIQVKLQMTHMQACVFFQCSGFALVSNDRDGTLTYEKVLR